MRGGLDAVASILTTGRCDVLALDWPALRYQHTAAVRAALADGRYAPTTANRHIAAMRGVLRECWRLGYVSLEEYHRATDLEPIRGSRLPRGRALQTGELKALSTTVPAIAARATTTCDAASPALLYGSGLRRAEVVALDPADHDRQAGALKIRGKGKSSGSMNSSPHPSKNWRQACSSCTASDRERWPAAGDNPARLRGEAGFAMPCSAAALPASSGKTQEASTQPRQGSLGKRAPHGRL